MGKQNFLELEEDLGGFEIIDPQSAQSGLTAQILWDLWDIGAKFGRLDQKGIRFKMEPMLLELYDYRGNKKGGSAGLFVAKIRPSMLTDEGTLLFQLKNNISIIWDRGFSVPDILRIIAEIDKIAQSRGQKTEGKRIILFEEERLKTARLSVELLRGGGVVPVLPDTSIEDALSVFDHPELLDIIDEGSLKLLCLKSEKQGILKKRAERIEKVSEMGITAEDIDKMSMQDILELRKKL